MGRYRRLVNEIRKKSFPEIKGFIWIIRIPFPIPGGVAMWLLPRINLLGFSTKCRIINEKVLTGLIAHELSHLSLFQEKRCLDFWKLFFSSTHEQIVREERGADILTIKKGYGKELIATKREAKKLLTGTKWEKHLKGKYLDEKEVKDYMKKLKNNSRKNS